MPSSKTTKKSAIKRKPIRVVELFAGVGGFRVGLEQVNGKPFDVIWSNQHEPGKRKQWASWIYEARWPESTASKHSNKPIEEAIAAREVPEHEMLVGGFPCQDYSVAKPKNQSQGIQGKKGVLWWSIYDILKLRHPDYLLLENVDRLVKSPSNQRGRDFAVMLRCLNKLGYHVEWRVINAADYGMPQRRRRVFVFGYRKNTKLGKSTTCTTPKETLLSKGLLAKTFPVRRTNSAHKKPSEGISFETVSLKGDLHEISKLHATPFLSAGLAIANRSKSTVHMAALAPAYRGRRVMLGDILLPESQIDKSFRIPTAALKSWVKQKTGKREIRVNYQTTVDRIFDFIGLKPDDESRTDLALRRMIARAVAQKWKMGSDVELELNLAGAAKCITIPSSLITATRFEYPFAEGSLPIPDLINRPMRTIITSEGGVTPSRFKHLICCECAKKWKASRTVKLHNCLEEGNLRRLTPEELEAGNMFDSGHTGSAILKGKQLSVPANKRAFLMGNALVCGVIKRLGQKLARRR